MASRTARHGLDTNPGTGLCPADLATEASTTSRLAAAILPLPECGEFDSVEIPALHPCLDLAEVLRPFAIGAEPVEVGTRHLGDSGRVSRKPVELDEVLRKVSCRNQRLHCKQQSGA